MDAGLFPTTIWSEVRRGGGRGGEGVEGRRAALETLARRYQAPAEAFLRAALGRSREESHELFQAFFAWMLASEWLAKAEPERGRFRAFLKVALRRFATDELRKGAAEKRGGGRAASAVELAEDAPAFADPRARTPEDELDAVWRAALVEEAFERTRLALEREGRGVQFAVLRDYYLASGPEPDYRALAARHALTTTDVSNFLQRAKKAFRAELRALVLDTVATPADLGEELVWLVGPETGTRA